MASNGPIKVTEQEYRLEVEAQTQRLTFLKQLWSRNSNLARNVQYWRKRVDEYEGLLNEFFILPFEEYKHNYLRLRDVTLPNAVRKYNSYAEQQSRVIEVIKTEQATFRSEAARIKRKVIIRPPPPGVPQKIIAVVDSRTGYMITYFDKLYREYQVWLVKEGNPDEYVQPVHRIKIEYTYSIETSGHEDMIAEITAWTIIDSLLMNHEGHIKDITEDVIGRAEAWFFNLFASQKEGGKAAFGGIDRRTVFSPDFSIQEQVEDAQFEGAIERWQKTLVGVQKVPRVLKRGVGYYVTDEDPFYPRIYIYAEWAHDDEPVGTHRLPKANYTTI